MADVGVGPYEKGIYRYTEHRSEDTPETSFRWNNLWGKDGGRDSER